MVVSTLAVPYRDTGAAELGWSLGIGELPAVASLDVRPAGDGSRLRLRVLSASHQVVLHRPAPHAPLVETVACLPRELPGLPPSADVALPDGFRYTLRSEVADLDAAALAVEVERLVREHGEDPDGLVGHFPGHRHAVTVVRADRGPDRSQVAGWRSWHAYPLAGQIVRTKTRIMGPEKGCDT